jgi:hypothetical protein
MEPDRAGIYSHHLRSETQPVSETLCFLGRMVSSGMLRRVSVVRTDGAEELSTSFIRVTRIGELGTTLAVTSNRRILRRNDGGAKFHRNVGSYKSHTA